MRLKHFKDALEDAKRRSERRKATEIYRFINDASMGDGRQKPARW
jgi:hypothetical protein